LQKAEVDRDTWYQQKRAEERHQEALDAVKEEFAKLDDESFEKAQAHFEMIVE
jgi:hypothetical protein